jgi:endonuclease YncB( thermonuclease family)
MPNRRHMMWSSVIFLGFAGLALYVFGGAVQKDMTGTAEAIDGDSLRLNGQEIRLKGLDAPELLQSCKVSGRDIPCGREARSHLRRLLQSGLVTCVSYENDRFGRHLGECRVRGIDINAAMVRDGHAVAFGNYLREEAEARQAYRGIWAGSFERPRDYRQRHPSGRSE